jgi:hypothetical protein
VAGIAVVSGQSMLKFVNITTNAQGHRSGPGRLAAWSIWEALR